MNSNHNVSNAYEEEFWKLKASRLQMELQQTKADNTVLREKVMDLKYSEQCLMDQLKQREEGLSSRKQSPSWGTESPIPGVKNDSEVKVNPQIEKLAKQIRVLKNMHLMQLQQLTEESRRDKRKIQDLEVRANQMTESEAVQAAIGKAGEEARNQRRKISRLEETNLRLRTQNDQFLNDMANLKKQLIQCKAESRFATQRMKQLQNVKQGGAQSDREWIKNSQTDKSEDPSDKQMTDLLDRINELQFKLSEETSKVVRERKEIANKLLNQELLIKKQADEIDGLKDELTSVLTKLAPLLKIKQNQVESLEKKPGERAALSLLEVYLSRYKIEKT